MPADLYQPGYTPVSWYKRPDTSTLSVYVPQYITYGDLGSDGLPQVTRVPPTLFVFDAALKASHRSELTVTKLPIQTGAAITDHTYINPPELVAEIMMSDVMQSYVFNQFGGGPNRSANAFQTVLGWQNSSLLLSVSTRLKTYDNMVVKSVVVEESSETLFSLKCSIVFTQILLVSNSLVGINQGTDSSRPQTSNSIQSGDQNNNPVPSSVYTSNYVSDTSPVFSGGKNISSAGNWSSNNIHELSPIVP